MTLLVLLTLLVVPLLALAVDCGGLLRTARGGRPGAAHRRTVVEVAADSPACDDYTLVVPIYGHTRYLENVPWLRPHAERVLLATSGSETPEFLASLAAIAAENGFRVHVGRPRPLESAARRGGRRSTGGTLRDAVVRDAHEVIDSTYVVCIDADTTIDTPVPVLVGAVRDAGLDLASVPLAVANPHGLLGRLQRIEYATAMRLRRLMPWLVCGGCHVARREAHAELMAQHSLFFQGNDVELGILAVAGGYRVGHVDVVVPTTVPETVRGWCRQRYAWAGGEFRIMLVNIRESRRHPYLYLYGALVSFGLAPLRWWSAARSTWTLALVALVYVVVVALLNRRLHDPLVLVYPVYALVYAFVFLPLGLISYVTMASRSRNAGIIRPRSRPDLRQDLRHGPRPGAHRVGLAAVALVRREAYR